MNILDVIRNEFLHAIGTDHIAVDHAGVPIARAADRAAVVQAAPDAAAYFSGADLEEAAPAPVTEIPATAPEPVIAETTQVDATTAPPAPALADAPPDPNPPTDQPPQDSDLLPTAKTAPIDLSLAPVVPDAPAVFSRPVIVAPEAATVQAEQPPQDNDHVEPGAEEFPEPTVPAADPAKLN